MKNKLLLMLIIAMSFALQVHAEPNIAPADVKVEHIIISGSLPVWENTDISLRVYNTGKENETITDANFFDVVNYQNQTQADKDGKFKFEYDMVGEQGEYFFTIEARGYDFNYTSSFDFYGKEYIDGIFQLIETAKENDDSVEVKNLIENNADKIQFTAPIYEALKSDSDKMDELYIKLLNREEIDSIYTLEQQLDETAVLINIKYAENSQSVNTEKTVYGLLTEYKDLLKLNENTAYKTLTNDKIIKKTQRDNITDSYLNADFENAEKFVLDLEKKIILTGINTAENYGQIRDIMQENFGIIKTTKHTDLSKLKYPDEVYLILFGSDKRNTYQTLSELAQAFDNAVTVRLQAEGGSPNDNQGGYSGNNAGGGTDSKIGSVGIPSSISGSVPFVQNETFNDLQGYEWAKDAINRLSSKGIINGMQSGKFEPSANVTREQFVKMIVVAFELKTDKTKVEFSDTDESAWYYPYVVSAYENGIISGKSTECFGIGENITRQDMAVILYRLQPDIFADKTESEFSDKNLISDYALEAVNALNNKGVIQGMEEQIFAPKMNATRAQAAVIISRMLDICNK